MKSYGCLSDDVLLELIRDGKKRAFDELYNRYWEHLYSHAYKRIKNKEICEEIVQDFFTDLWCRRESISINTSVEQYLAGAAKFQTFKYLKKEYQRRSLEAFLQETQKPSDNFAENLIETNDLERRINDEVKTLSPKCKEVYELSRHKFKNKKEIATLMGISEKTVENHLTRALRALRLSVKELIAILATLLFYHF